MSYKPGDTYWSEFTTQNPSTGAAVNADSLPTATLAHNGADDGTVTLTVTNVDTGRYKLTGTIPAGYTSGDKVQVIVSATVNSVAGKAVVDSFVLDSKRNSDLQDLSQAGVQTALTNQGYNATRAPYLDNLNVGGPVASSAQVLNIQNNTFVSTNIPAVLERPDSGSVTVPITIVFADDTGAAKDLDSGNPTILLTNDAGTDLSSRLSAISHPATGKYALTYTSSPSDTIEGLHWEITGTLNTKLRRYVAPTQIVDTTALDFTATDRSNLTAIKAQTDKLLFDGSSYVKSDPQTAVTVGTNNDKNGYGLAVAPPTAAQIDAQLSGTHGAGQWGSTGSSGEYTISVIVKDANTLATLQKVQVTIKDSGDTTILDQMRTDTSGQVSASLDAGTYKVHVGNVPGYNSLAAQTLVVSGNTTVTYQITPIPASAPAAPGMCAVDCYVFEGGNPVQGATFSARLADGTQAISGAMQTHQVLTAVTDANGHAVLQLVQAASFLTGNGAYWITGTDPDGNQLIGSGAYPGALVTVPTQNSANLQALVPV